MSLKAKIEAVIYASEEPVTLAQLVSLLGEEAQTELDAQAAQQESLPLEETSESADADAPKAETLGEPASSAEPVEAEAPAEAAAESVPESEAAADAVAKEAAAAARVRERKLRDYFRTLLDQLIADYAGEERGMEIREVAGGFRLATKPEYHDAVRGFVKSLKPPLKLSLQALETLAVVAYKQPVTAPEVSEIRGVDSGGVLGSLMARKLVATAGRKQVIGRPILYKTTKEFLVRFGLKDLNELPSIEEFERMANEFAEAVQEEIPMVEEQTTRRAESEEDASGSAKGFDDEVNAASAVEPSAHVHEAQADGEPYSEENVSEENPSASSVDPADNAAVDGRISGVPPDYSREDHVEGDETDSPALDAEVQSGGKTGGA